MKIRNLTCLLVTGAQCDVKTDKPLLKAAWMDEEGTDLDGFFGREIDVTNHFAKITIKFRRHGY